jgi:hypothetical protein
MLWQVQTVNLEDCLAIADKMREHGASEAEPAAGHVAANGAAKGGAAHSLQVQLSDAPPLAAPGGAPAGFPTQLYLLTLREFRFVFRNKPALIASVMAPLILNLFFGCLFAGVGDTDAADYNLKGHFGAIAQVAISGMFGAAQPLLLRFPLERGIFLREFATEMYGTAAVPKLRLDLRDC